MWHQSARFEKSWPLFCQIWIIFTLLKLWIVSARHNFKWLKFKLNNLAVKGLKIVETYVMLKMVCIPSEANDYWKAKTYRIHYIQTYIAFHRNETWDFRVQLFISVISFQRNYTKWWVLSWEIKNIWLNVMYVTFVFRTHTNYVKSTRLLDCGEININVDKMCSNMTTLRISHWPSLVWLDPYIYPQYTFECRICNVLFIPKPRCTVYYVQF